MPFDYDYAEGLLQKAERIYKCLETETLPDACEDISYCENCSLGHLCEQMRRVPTDIIIDEELDALINRKIELQPLQTEYRKVDAAIKKAVGSKEKVLTGQFLIQQKTITKQAYTVPASSYQRMSIKKI
jgi:hypothetical protein